ncbi:MAG: hypothetical protein ACKOZW_03460, partial [Cyanobium sp.]
MAEEGEAWSRRWRGWGERQRSWRQPAAAPQENGAFRGCGVVRFAIELLPCLLLGLLLGRRWPSLPARLA